MQKINVYHRKDGRWEGRISRGKKDGKRKFQYIFAKTKEDAVAKINKIYADERNYDTCSKTVSEIFDEWYNSISHCIKESTASNYKLKATKHILTAFGHKQVNSISSDDIYSFISNKQESGLSNRYISDILVLMKSIIKYAVKKYHIYNIMAEISMPKKKNPDIKILDNEQQKKLQQYISDNHNYGTLGVALSMSTGIRIGELCALQWKDIDIEKRILTVNKTIQRIQCQEENTKTKIIITEPKSESSKRYIPIPKGIINFLNEFKGNSEHYVISGSNKPIEPRTMQYRFTNILKNVNLPSVHFHSLRHLFASNCISYGFDIKALSEILGHSSVEITLNRYVHSSFNQKIKYMKRLDISF